MEQFAAIRRDSRVEGLSIRELAVKYRVHRRTVRQALASAVPPPRKTPARSSPKLDPFKLAIDAMLVADTTAPRKQRHTARRILHRLIEEYGATELSYSTVRDYVRVRRAQIDVEAGRRVEVFVPQEHPPGAEAEVDFGEVWVMLAGVKTKCHMFVFWLAHSGKAIHRVYPTLGQEAFLEGHIEAFTAVGGIPTRHIRYDNLTSAVAAVLHGTTDRRRTENQRWVLFRSHFGFDAFYCQPGIAGAHEKGGVEGEVGRFRRNRLTPMPEVDSLAELNDRIRGWEAEDDGRRIADRTRTVGEDFAGGSLVVDHGADGQVLGAGVSSAARSGFLSERTRWWCLTDAPRSRPIRASPPAPEAVCSWITTWRYSRSSPARCPDLRRWPPHGPRGRLPRRMRRSGLPLGGSTAMPRAPANSSTCCCCTAA